MGTSEMFQRQNPGLSLAFVDSEKEQKMETPSLWPDSFLFPPAPGSRWPCEGSHRNTWEHPTWNICASSTLPFCSQRLLATLGPGLHTRVMAAFRRTTWGSDPHRSWKQAQGRHSGREFQDPRCVELSIKGEECWFWMGTFPRAFRPFFLLWEGMGLGRLDRDPLMLGA